MSTTSRQITPKNTETLRRIVSSNFKDGSTPILNIDGTAVYAALPRHEVLKASRGERGFDVTISLDETTIVSTTGSFTLAVDLAISKLILMRYTDLDYLLVPRNEILVVRHRHGEEFFIVPPSGALPILRHLFNRKEKEGELDQYKTVTTPTQPELTPISDDATEFRRTAWDEENKARLDRQKQHMREKWAAEHINAALQGDDVALYEFMTFYNYPPWSIEQAMGFGDD